MTLEMTVPFEPVRFTHQALRRTLALAVLLLVCAAGTGRAEEPEWQTGQWARPATPAKAGTSSRNYAIDTEWFRLEVQLSDVRQGPPLVATVGTAVTFAVTGTAVHVKQGKGERILHLLERTEKLKRYASAGAGHYLKTVAADGRTLTLEDGSVWEVSPTQRFRTIGWKPLAGITVSYDDRESTAIDLLQQAPTAFDYFLNNTDEDEGASARVLSTP
jgi:hypothetical protein